MDAGVAAAARTGTCVDAGRPVVASSSRFQAVPSDLSDLSDLSHLSDQSDLSDLSDPYPSNNSAGACRNWITSLRNRPAVAPSTRR